MTQVHYFSKYSSIGPSSRYRVYQYLDDFRKAGWEFEIFPLFEDEYFSTLRDSIPIRRALRKSSYALSRFSDRVARLSQNSGKLCVIEQQLFPYVPYLLEKPFLPRHFILELDDAVYLTHPQKLPKLFRQASGVIAGNEILADFVNQFQQNVDIIPTAIDSDIFKPSQRGSREKIIIGWSGLEYNFRYLHEIAPILADMLQKYPAEFVILSGSPPKTFPIPYCFEKWNPGLEAQQIGSFDIGLMPLKIDEWSRGKCAMKLLQYMSVGIPGVATAIGANTQVIQDGSNGFLAVTADDWKTKLQLLLENSALREEMGVAARKTVVEKYSTRVWFPKLLEVYQRYL